MKVYLPKHDVYFEISPIGLYILYLAIKEALVAISSPGIIAIPGLFSRTFSFFL